MSVYPRNVARSSSSEESGVLLASLLAAANIDELSNAEDFFSVKAYIQNSGRVDKNTGKTTTGLVFWLYPTGLDGPFHEDQEGQIQQHGTLITIERGTDYDVALQKSIESLRLEGIAHVHIAAN